MKPLVIRADAGDALGTGHVMRMIALAQAYIRRGGRVVMGSIRCPEPVIERITESDIEHRLLTGCELGDEQDAAASLQLCRELGAAWLVLDGYHFDETYQKRVWGNGAKVICVDDYGHCETWHCDAVLNQNLGSEKWPRAKTANPKMRWLMGSSFALIREEFLESINEAKATLLPARRVLVTMGGADIDNVTLMVLKALENTHQSGLQVRVLVGGANPHQNELHQFAKSSQNQIKVLCNVRDMPAMYEWADAVISAGGSTCWEWLAYGLPGAVVTIAENQEPVVKELDRDGLALALGWHHDFDLIGWSHSLDGWLATGIDGANFAVRRRAIDGYGAARAAALVSNHPLWVRPARLADMRLYFDWANDPVVRASGFHTDELVWDQHCAWFRKKLSDPACHLMVVNSCDSGEVGQVRLTPDTTGYLEIGFSIDKNYRGKGMGSLMLSTALEQISRDEPTAMGYIARVKKVNAPSAKIFTQLGFEQAADDPEHGCLVYIKK